MPFFFLNVHLVLQELESSFWGLASSLPLYSIWMTWTTFAIVIFPLKAILFWRIYHTRYVSLGFLFLQKQSKNAIFTILTGRCKFIKTWMAMSWYIDREGFQWCNLISIEFYVCHTIDVTIFCPCNTILFITKQIE